MKRVNRDEMRYESKVAKTGESLQKRFASQKRANEYPETLDESKRLRVSTMAQEPENFIELAAGNTDLDESDEDNLIIDTNHFINEEEIKVRDGQRSSGSSLRLEESVKKSYTEKLEECSMTRSSRVPLDLCALVEALTDEDDSNNENTTENHGSTQTEEYYNKNETENDEALYIDESDDDLISQPVRMNFNPRPASTFLGVPGVRSPASTASPFVFHTDNLTAFNAGYGAAQGLPKPAVHTGFEFFNTQSSMGFAAISSSDEGRGPFQSPVNSDDESESNCLRF